VNKYDFTEDWFSPHWSNWLAITEGARVAKILEVGSFEGRSTCAMIDEFGGKGPLEVHCIDSWDGSFEHGEFDMEAVERRFDQNVSRAIAEMRESVKLYKHKGSSLRHLSALINEGHVGTFDLIFIDGSHMASDVLGDLVLGYHLCVLGGLIICDDYLWSGLPHGSEDLFQMPRPAIDAFMQIFARKITQLGGLPLYQVYLRKTA
jgi:predicted O-methyltransferase YrrM